MVQLKYFFSKTDPEVDTPKDVPLSGATPLSSMPEGKDNGLPPTDDEGKIFYENLPFHGMAAPPNKVSDRYY